MVQSYYKVDGKALGEKNPKLLQDDYVKFLRFAQWKIHKAGEGIVGMITNHGYLDNATFRGMRYSIMKTFNEIYILNLHGNSLKKETTPYGGKDENVFDIRQGVAIALFIKLEGKSGCQVYYTDLYGLRKEKYHWLANSDMVDARYQEIKPKSPWYFFIHRKTEKIKYYLNWPKINDIFPVNVSGIKTHRDNFVIGFSEKEIKNRMLQFRNLSLHDDLIINAFKLKDTADWKLPNARKDLANDDNWDTYYQKILYRPFDVRNIYYTRKMIDRGREIIMRHMLQKNLSICFMRQFAGNISYSHFIVSEYMVDNRTFFSSKGIIQQAPLYLYADIETLNLFSSQQSAKEPNIAPQIFKMLGKAYGRKPTPEEILYYINAVFYSNIYRDKFAEYLKIDFPRVPFTKDKRLFKKLAKYGKRLAYLHLMQSPELDSPVAKFQGVGDKRVEKIKYDKDGKCVYINKDQYFEGLTENIWQYYIGGYQVCDKWLKDRKDKVLSLDDIKHYCKIATAIKHTINIQKSIDEIYNKAEKEVIGF